MTTVLGQNAIVERAAAVYAAAGLVIDAMTESVAPLQRLIQAHGLIADEIDKLSRHEAAAYLAEQTGGTIRLGDPATDELAGFLFANAAGGWILVKRGEKLVRRRFTVAHELGHYLLHYLPELDSAMKRGDDLLEFEEEVLAPADPDADESEVHGGRSTLLTDMGTEARTEIDQMELERQADAFAAVVLMPEKSCQRLVAKYAERGMTERNVLARRLASECLVSERAMRRRLGELHLGQEMASGR